MLPYLFLSVKAKNQALFMLVTSLILTPSSPCLLCSLHWPARCLAFSDMLPETQSSQINSPAQTQNIIRPQIEETWRECTCTEVRTLEAQHCAELWCEAVVKGKESRLLTRADLSEEPPLSIPLSTNSFSQRMPC